MASPSPWSWGICLTRRAPLRTTLGFADWRSMARKNGGIMSPMSWSAWLLPSNPTTWCSAEATSGSLKSCPQVAAQALMPTHFLEDFAYGRKPRPRKVPLLQNGIHIKAHEPDPAPKRKRKRHEYESDYQTTYSVQGLEGPRRPPQEASEVAA